MSLYRLTQFLGLVLMAGSTAAQSDRYDRLKVLFRDMPCFQLEFEDIVSSDIFETVDSLPGLALLARDGRYRLKLGSDQYLFDGEQLYCYSPENNQVTVEKTEPGDFREVSFMRHLDVFYNSTLITRDREYQLIRSDDSLAVGLPDTLRLFLVPGRVEIERLLYHDENGDQHDVRVSKQRLFPSCPEELFVPAWPDSTEVIRID